MTLSAGLSIGLSFMVANAAAAECVIEETVRKLDPVEVGFCEADAVFVGKVASRLETTRAYREEGSDHTKHYRIESSTIDLQTRFKGAVPAKVTMVSDLYDKQGAFSFALGQEYLIFAKHLKETDEYAGASAACSVQPTLKLADAEAVLRKLQAHAKGTAKIDCKNIKPKALE